MISDLVRENVADCQDSVDKLCTTIVAKNIRIGSYRYEPKEKVVISYKGIRIIAPNVKRQSENVILDIQKSEIVKIVSHFAKSLPTLFIYTVNSCGSYIRDSLEMSMSNDEGKLLVYFLFYLLYDINFLIILI